MPLTLESVTRAYFEFARQEPVYYRMQLALVFAPRHSEAYSVAAGWNEAQPQRMAHQFQHGRFA